MSSKKIHTPCLVKKWCGTAGGGTGNWAGHGVRDRSDAASVKRHTKHQMNRGWEMVTWDVNHEENEIVSGEKTLVAGLWQYDAFWIWVINNKKNNWNLWKYVNYLWYK